MDFFGPLADLFRRLGEVFDIIIETIKLAFP